MESLCARLCVLVIALLSSSAWAQREAPPRPGPEIAATWAQAEQPGIDQGGEVPDGEVPDGEVPDGEVPDGEVPEGEVPEGAPVAASETPRSPPWARAGIAAASAGLGAAGGYLLALPVGVALVYLLPLAGISPLWGVAPLLIGVPLGAGIAAGLFAQGVTPLGAALAGGAAFLGVGAATLGIVAYTLTASPTDFDGVVLAAVTLPAIAGAACAAITAPLTGLE